MPLRRYTLHAPHQGSIASRFVAAHQVTWWSRHSSLPTALVLQVQLHSAAANCEGEGVFEDCYASAVKSPGERQFTLLHQSTKAALLSTFAVAGKFSGWAGWVPRRSNHRRVVRQLLRAGQHAHHAVRTIRMMHNAPQMLGTGMLVHNSKPVLQRNTTWAIGRRFGKSSAGQHAHQ